MSDLISGYPGAVDTLCRMLSCEKALVNLFSFPLICPVIFPPPLREIPAQEGEMASLVHLETQDPLDHQDLMVPLDLEEYVSPPFICSLNLCLPFCRVT